MTKIKAIKGEKGRYSITQKFGLTHFNAKNKYIVKAISKISL